MFRKKFNRIVHKLKVGYDPKEDYKTTNTLKILKQEKPDLIIIYNDHDFKILNYYFELSSINTQFQTETFFLLKLTNFNSYWLQD